MYFAYFALFSSSIYLSISKSLSNIVNIIKMLRSKFSTFDSTRLKMLNNIEVEKSERVRVRVGLIGAS